MWVDVEILLVIAAVFFVMIFLSRMTIFCLPIPSRLSGKISYSLYLLHLPVLNLIQEPARHSERVYLYIHRAGADRFFCIYTLIEAPARKAVALLWSQKAGACGANPAAYCA